MTKLKIALAALLVAGTASAMAQGEYDPIRQPLSGLCAPGATLRSAPVQRTRAHVAPAFVQNNWVPAPAQPAALAKHQPPDRRSPAPVHPEQPALRRLLFF